MHKFLFKLEVSFKIVKYALWKISANTTNSPIFCGMVYETFGYFDNVSLYVWHNVATGEIEAIVSIVVDFVAFVTGVVVVVIIARP